MYLQRYQELWPGQIWMDGQLHAHMHIHLSKTATAMSRFTASCLDKNVSGIMYLQSYQSWSQIFGCSWMDGHSKFGWYT